MNHLNKGGQPLAEGEEERPLIKENTRPTSTHSTQSEVRVSQGLTGVRKAAMDKKGQKFTALLQHFTVGLLRDECFALKRKAAPGVDGLKWQEYETGLEVRLHDLHGRVRRRRLLSATVEEGLYPEAQRQRPLRIAALRG